MVIREPDCFIPAIAIERSSGEQKILIGFKAHESYPEEISVTITYHRQVSLYVAGEPWIPVGDQMVEITVDHDAIQSNENNRGVERAKRFMSAYSEALDVARRASGMAEEGKCFDEVAEEFTWIVNNRLGRF
jgi:hypothetical protein